MHVHHIYACAPTHYPLPTSHCINAFRSHSDSRHCAVPPVGRFCARALARPWLPMQSRLCKLLMRHLTWIRTWLWA